VKIDIHQQLYKWRQVPVKEGYTSAGKTAGMKMMSGVLSGPRTYKTAGKMGRWVMRAFPAMVNNRLNPWYKQREMPTPPKQSFSEWYKKNKKSS
jgi:L-lactate dehydrogenase complex protein LldF